MTEIMVCRFSGPELAGEAGDFLALHAEVYPAPLAAGKARGGAGPAQEAAEFARRWRVSCRQPGCAVVTARSGGYLVGYATGLPLRPATSWWRQATTELPAEFTAEHPGRTFAVTELAVRPAWRRQGLGADLHDLLLAGRAEERAAIAVPPSAGPAQQALRSWGWRKAGRARSTDPDAPARDLLIRPLG